VPDRPYTLLSCALSIDGYLDGGTDERLHLSNAVDYARVDAVRAESDAVLVGATTVRHDDPRLLVRSARLRDERVSRGLTPTPAKVTLTRRADLDPGAAFFTAGVADRLVYCPTGSLGRATRRLGEVATVVDGGWQVDMGWLSADLHGRGVRRLMVEGGASVHTQFLTADLVDELQLVVAPFFVGNPHASRFVGTGQFPFHPGRRATLADVRPIGDVVLLRYALSPRCAAEMNELSDPVSLDGAEL
jgi:5-amino-6-(5-phosphoribosylamino)uracil reductase